MNYLLDTCALLHYSLQPDRLSVFALEEITNSANQVWLSVISAGELACLQNKGRIEFRSHWKIWFRDAVERSGWEPLPITQEIMEEAYSLPEPIHRDPADRLLIATSRIHRMPLVTTDSLILNYPHVESLA